MLRNATLTLYEFCQGMLHRIRLSLSESEQVNNLVLLALRHLINSTDEQVLTDACEAFFHISTNYKIQFVIDAGVIPRLVDLLLHPSDKVVFPALGTVYQIVTNDSIAHKQYILDNQVLLPRLYQLLTQNRDKDIRIRACLTISKITSGNRDQIQIFGQPRMHQTTL